jgi:hypothetical protein
VRKANETDAEMLERFKRDIRRDADLLDELRDKANEDMRFVYVDGGQWEGFLESQYENRAKLEFDLISQYKNKFVGEWRDNRIGVEFKPDDDDTGENDAEFINGVYRADYRDGYGKVAIDNAVNECATCGFGAFGLSTRYVDEEDPENEEQDIVWRPIFNAYNTVYFDQSARRIDKLDARWANELKPYTKEAFEDEYPELEAVSAYTPKDRALFNYNGSSDEVYIATRYEVIKKRESVFVYNNLANGKVEYYHKEEHDLIKDELAEIGVHTFVKERKIMRRKVMMARFTGNEFIEKPRVISGKFIPIIPMYAYRAYIDGVEYWYGLVRKYKDAGRAYNAQMSQLIENAASAGQEVPIFTREQIEAPDVSATWADKNNKPFLFVDAATDDNGNVIANGPIGYSKPPMLDQNTSALLEIIPNYLREVTGGAPQDTLDPDASGKAINAIIKRINLNTQEVSDNIREAIQAGGDVYISIASEIYTEKRAKKTLSNDGIDSREMMHKLVKDEQIGRLIESNTIKGKKFKAYSDIGAQYQSMQEQTVEDLKGLLEAITGKRGEEVYTPAIIAAMLENASGVGLKPLKKIARQQMLLQGLAKPETDEERAYVQQMMQPKQDPNQKLVEAAVEQQLAEAKNLQAATIDKIASAKKKEAETQEIYSELGINQLNQLLNSRKQILRQ